MRKCVYCNYYYKKNSNISFHKFPTNFKLRQEWLQYMSKSFNSSNIKQNDSLCSQHFEDKCFNENNCRRSLKCGSVPTIFKNHKFKEIETTKQTVPNVNLIDAETNEVQHREKQNDTQLIELKPASSCYVYNPATHTLTVTENKNSSPSQYGDSKFTDSNTKAITKTDHDYEMGKRTMKSRHQHSVAHDHQYENRKTLAHMKQLLRCSSFRSKVVHHRKRLKSKISLKTVMRDLNARIKRMYSDINFV